MSKKKKTPKKTPGFCYFIPVDGFIKGHGHRVSVVYENESGHRPTGTWPYHGKVGEVLPYFWGQTYEEAIEACDLANARMGIDKVEAQRIVASSMMLGMMPQGVAS